jgi:hypothetical protein
MSLVRIEPTTSWIHIKILTIKLIQNFMNKDEKK